MDKGTYGVIESVLRLLNENQELRGKKKWGRLAELANRQHIKSPRGARWSGASFHVFCKRQGLLMETEQAEPSPVKAETQLQSPEEPSIIHEAPRVIPRKEDDVTPTAYHVIPPKDESIIPEDATVIPLERKEVSELRKMLRWWQEQGGESAGLPLPLRERPRFNRSNAVRATIRLGKALFDDASRWAKTRRAETGGNFSGLVEVLLWERLGRDPKYLRQTKDEEPGAGGDEEAS